MNDATVRFIGKDGARIEVVEREPAALVLAIACRCGQAKVRGTGKHIKGEGWSDTYEASAICVNCGERRGRIEAQVSTLFGLHEDEAVLNGRPRVY